MAFTEGSIRELLTNRVYTGKVVWRPHTDEEEVRQGRHDAVISPELFERVQEVRLKRAHWRGRRPANRHYPLTRRAYCYDCGSAIAGDTGGKKNQRRYRHARSVPCDGGWKSRSATQLEEQLGQLIDARIRLPDDWQKRVLALVATPVAPQDDTAPKRKRLERAQESLRKQHTWSDIDDEQYRTEREAIERQLRDLEPRRKLPISLPDIQRGGILLTNLSNLLRHPGVSAKNQQAFIQEAFERIEVDELGIRAVQFADALLPAVAVTGVGGNGAGEGIRTLDPLLGKQMLYP